MSGREGIPDPVIQNSKPRFRMCQFNRHPGVVKHPCMPRDYGQACNALDAKKWRRTSKLNPGSRDEWLG
jgi:hypothetical protein